MRKRGDSTQLDLDLPEGKKIDVVHVKGPINVVQFVDAATMDVRRNAVRRVAASGIFYLHPRLRDHKNVTK